MFAPLNKFRVIPLHLMYRPANTIPYASVESDLKGVYVKYCLMDSAGRLVARTVSEVEQKCCTFQHWIHQWTNGNLLVTRLEGKEMFCSTSIFWVDWVAFFHCIFFVFLLAYFISFLLIYFKLASLHIYICFFFVLVFSP